MGLHNIGHQLHLNICLEQPDKLAMADTFNQDYNIQLYNTKSSHGSAHLVATEMELNPKMETEDGPIVRGS